MFDFENPIVVIEEKSENRKIQVDGKLYTTSLKRVGKNRFYVTIGSRTYAVIFPEDIDFKLSFDAQVKNKPYKLQVVKSDEEYILLTVNGKMHEVKILEKLTPTFQRKEPYPIKGPQPTEIYQPSLQPEISRKTSALGDVTAPMPGIIVSVKVKRGDEVNLGDQLCILEAMKMENEITATKPGIVEEVAVYEGASVAQGQLLVKIK